MKKQRSIQLIITTLIVPARSLVLILFTILALTSKAQHQSMLMRLVASGLSMQNETVIYFDSAATYNYDPQFDAPSLGVNDGYLNIVTRLTDIDYQINAIPAIGQNMTIPVKITTGTSGTYSVFATDLNDLPQGASIHLHDQQSHTDQDLRNGTAQYFISDTETIARFLLVINVNIMQNLTVTGINPTCSSTANGVIHAYATGTGPFDYYWKDSLNNIIRIALNKGTTDSLTDVKAGIYRADLTTPGTDNNATVYFQLNGNLSAEADFLLPSSTVTLNNGIANVHFTNTSTNGQYFTWDFGDGMGSAVTSPNHSYNQVGSYTISLTAGNSTCNDISVHKEEILIVATTGIVNSSEQRLMIESSPEGYFVRTSSFDGILSVTDLLGRKIIEDVTVKTASRIYLGADIPANEVLVIHATGDNYHESLKFIKPR